MKIFLSKDNNISEKESKMLNFNSSKGLKMKTFLAKDNDILELKKEDIDFSSLRCLNSFIGDNSPLDEPYIYNLTHKLLLILEFFKKNKIIHGNIHPKNIFVLSDNSVVLTSEVFDDESFKAPEVQKDKKKIKLDIRNDLYSLGASLLVVLTRKNIDSLEKMNGKFLFRRETGINIYYKDLIDEMIEPILKYRIKNPKKALKMLDKITSGKKVDPYAKQEALRKLADKE